MKNKEACGGWGVVRKQLLLIIGHNGDWCLFFGENGDQLYTVQNNCNPRLFIRYSGYQ